MPHVIQRDGALFITTGLGNKTPTEALDFVLASTPSTSVDILLGMLRGLIHVGGDWASIAAHHLSQHSNTRVCNVAAKHFTDRLAVLRKQNTISPDGE